MVNHVAVARESASAPGEVLSAPRDTCIESTALCPRICSMFAVGMRHAQYSYSLTLCHVMSCQKLSWM